jgi:glycosyltransferase involved in cell wall biosynthesis
MAIELSAVIITYNEERNIGRCLESLWGIADEIVVVDSFSTDRTREICEEQGVRFYQRAFDGYSAQKNFGNSLAVQPYIISLDADEALSECLKKEVMRIKENWEKDAYRMKRLAYYCGKWIHHGGWYPDIKLRIFDKRIGSWSGKSVHEEVVMKEGARVGMLDGTLFHYSYYSVDEHVRRSNRYSTLAAEELSRKGASCILLKLLLKPCFRFLRDYIFRLGFLDGFQGYLIARITAHATLLKYAKVRILKRGGPVH